MHQLDWKRARRRPADFRPFRALAAEVVRVHHHVAHARFGVREAEAGGRHRRVEQPAPVAERRQVRVAVVAREVLHAVAQNRRPHPVEAREVRRRGRQVGGLVEAVVHVRGLRRVVVGVVHRREQHRAALAALGVDAAELDRLKPRHGAQEVEVVERILHGSRIERTGRMRRGHLWQLGIGRIAVKAGQRRIGFAQFFARFKRHSRRGQCREQCSRHK